MASRKRVLLALPIWMRLPLNKAGETSTQTRLGLLPRRNEKAKVFYCVAERIKRYV